MYEIAKLSIGGPDLEGQVEASAHQLRPRILAPVPELPGHVSGKYRNLPSGLIVIGGSVQLILDRNRLKRVFARAASDYHGVELSRF